MTYRPYHYSVPVTDGVVVATSRDAQGTPIASIAWPRDGVAPTEEGGPKLPEPGSSVTLWWTDFAWVTPGRAGATRSYRYRVTQVRGASGGARALVFLAGADAGTGTFTQPHAPFGDAVPQPFWSRVVAVVLGFLLALVGLRRRG